MSRNRSSTLASADPSRRQDHLAHIAETQAITDGYVNGVAVKALCGALIVPSRDPAGFPECTTCASILRLSIEAWAL